ncbi:MAG TPA: YgeY family selenium metabolism-linked hydrolase [Anaerolineales bacterium]|nr:YgeY family selenium metabolism-linked hydrolase [Anaerolineales bacterium]
MDKQRLTAFAQELIRERSMSGEEQKVVARVVAEMRALAFDQVWVDEYGSAVGVIEGKRPGKTLLMDGHCDIVDARAEDWKHPPFAAVIEDGYLYGRGVADMKGPLAAMIHAAASVDRGTLAGKVIVSAGVLEEVMEGVALQQVMNAVKPDAVLIGESTNFALNRAGRGRAEIVVETIGKSAHSSSPQAGLCAVHEMIRLMEALEAIPMASHPAMGRAQICLTDIISEPFPGHSVVPNRCRVSYDRRLIPGETPESVLAEIRALPELNNIHYSLSVLDGEERTYTGKTLKGLKFFPAWVFEEDHPLVRAARKGLRSSGIEPKLGSFGFCTNAAYSAGVAGIPTIGFGPGTEPDAHTVNERMKVADLARAAEGYLGMIQAILSE